MRPSLACLVIIQALIGPPAMAQPTLHAAAIAGDTATIHRLLAAGTPVDTPDPTGRTPLLEAVEHNQTEAGLALLNAGASPNAQAANADTPWLLAGASGRATLLAAMIPHGPDLSIRNRYGGNALIPACERGHVETVDVLLTTKIDLDHINRLDWTCLLEIILLGDGGPRHQTITRRILAAGANPNLPDGQGITPLAHARARGQHEIAALIEGAGGRMKK